MPSNSATNPASSGLFAEGERQRASSGAPARGRPAKDPRTAAAASPRTAPRTSSSRIEISTSKEVRLQELALMSLAPIVRSIHHWWLHRAERHYLICADVEQQRAREAQMNVAYYQKRAALARSARN